MYAQRMWRWSGALYMIARGCVHARFARFAAGALKKKAKAITHPYMLHLLLY
jgi:hypothetical protein